MYAAAAGRPWLGGLLLMRPRPERTPQLRVDRGSAACCCYDRGPNTRYAAPIPAYLEQILAQHRRLAAEVGRDLGELAARAASVAPPRPFLASLSAASGSGASGAAARPDRAGIAVIAEVKRRSPSKGDLAPGLDPAALARDYETGGAACLSVLTDAEFFGGSAADLQAARSACSLPVLRKDFTVVEADLYDARIMGADAVLLIVAALSDEELARFTALAGALGLAALVEVHDEEELRRALDAGAALIGVNQRDLRTFEVDTARAERVRAAVPAGVTTVAESGIRTGEDLRRLAAAGFDAALIGETLVVSGDPRRALRELLAVAGELASAAVAQTG
jgi:indole-3-glycerol phosphate synthase